ncbi:MAG TPA: type II secretion system F family protein [Acetobacteraceae bacterium]|nr:type II secretion system F family protein [Acetobacteraceae bacterium]
MTGHGLLWLLLVLSCLSLAGLGVSGMLVSRSQKTKAKREARMASVGSPRSRMPQVEMSAFTRPARTGNRSLPAMAAAVFGFDLDRPEQYPLRWWMVLVLALAIAKAMQSLAAEVVGDFSYAVIPVAWVMLCRNVFGWSEGRRRQKLLHQFPDVLAMIVRSVRVGIPVMEAMRAVSREMPAPTAPEFLRMVEQVSIGVALEEAVAELAQRCGIPEYRFFATALSLQNQTGGALSETLDNLADVIRKRIALIAKGHAMASEAKTCAAVLGALPVVTGAALYLLSPGYFGLLFSDPTGRALFGSAVMSLFSGLMVMRSMIRRSLK